MSRSFLKFADSLLILSKQGKGGAMKATRHAAWPVEGASDEVVAARGVEGGARSVFVGCARNADSWSGRFPMAADRRPSEFASFPDSLQNSSAEEWSDALGQRCLAGAQRTDG